MLETELVVEAELVEHLSLSVSKLRINQHMPHECVANKHLADSYGTAPVHIGVV